MKDSDAIIDCNAIIDYTHIRTQHTPKSFYREQHQCPNVACVSYLACTACFFIAASTLLTIAAVRWPSSDFIPEPVNIVKKQIKG